MSFRQGSIKYHFLSLWYDSTCDWTQVYRDTGEHSNHYANNVEIQRICLYAGGASLTDRMRYTCLKYSRKDILKKSIFNFYMVGK